MSTQLQQSDDQEDTSTAPWEENAYLLCGPVCSGKSEVSDYIDSLYSTPVFEMGDLARTLHEQSDTTLSVSEWAGQRKETHGEEWVARRFFDTYQISKPVVFSGLRSVAELREFERNLGRCKVIMVTAPIFTRYQRNLERGDRAITDPGEFFRRDWREFQWGIGDLVERDLVDHLIFNRGDVDYLKDRVDEILRFGGIELEDGEARYYF